MATVAELIHRVGRIELKRARALARYREADRALLDANDDLRDAMIVAARDPDRVAEVAGLSTIAEFEQRFGT